MSNAWEEGDHVRILSQNGIPEQGVIMKYHARGESELDLGLIWIASGQFVRINPSSTRVLGCEIRRVEPERKSRSAKAQRKLRAKRGRPFEEPRIQAFVRLETRGSVTKDDFNLRPCDSVPFRGRLDATEKFRSLHAVITALESNGFIMQRKANAEVLATYNLRKYLKDASKGRTEGVWMNPTVSIAALKHFGIPKAYLNAGKQLVPSYNQVIFQVDGSDTARTLGMHKDRDANDKEVNTLLGCVASDGAKDIIVWRGSLVDAMPRWWRNEGLSRQAFALALTQCEQVDSVRANVSVLSLKPGRFVFMPKGTWHWACPGEDTKWTAMITSSFYYFYIHLMSPSHRVLVG